MTLDIHNKIREIFSCNESHEYRLEKITLLIKGLRKEGRTKDDLLSALQALRADVSDEEEDIILEAMDFLTGWCSPHAKIE